MTDPKPPEFVGDVRADEPALGAPLERLPELLEPVAMSPGGLERLMSAVAEPPLRYAPWPKLAGTEAYLARFAAGMKFPMHRHLGNEDVLILEGSYTDSNGTVYGSGDVHHMDGGTAHTFTIAPDEPCVAAAVHRGIRFTSLAMRVLAKLFGG